MKEFIERAAIIDLITRRYEQPELCTYEINSIPAADVAEVKHGYWIDHHSGGSFCSVCKRWVPYSHHPKYCETCSARMDKEDEHEVD